MEDLRWRPPSLFWIILFMCGSLFLYYNISELQSYSLRPKLVYAPKPKQTALEEASLKGYFIRTPGCSIPEMKPMDASIKKYIYEEKEFICNDGMPPLVDSNMTSIFLLKPSLLSYNISDITLLKCCFQEFHRIDPGKNEKDNVVKFDEKCYEFNDSIKIPYEFIRVNCTYNQSQNYIDFFHFVPLKDNNTKVNAVHTNKLNILMIGIDAVSRLNLYRQLPKTVAFMKELKAIEMLGYNKVADNTFPNLVPILTGQTVEELQETCWPKDNDYFDKCPFVWSKYKDAGFTTTFAEDCAWMGLFLYQKKGFLHQPTDYYYGHFDKTTEKQIGNLHSMNVDLCFGSRAAYKYILEYTRRFTFTMHDKKRPYFGFFWGSNLSHDYLNKPKLGDGDYLELLKRLNSNGILNNTVLIFLSDHGIRWGDIRNTYQGRMEERLPFLFFKFPQWFMEEHEMLIDNLRTNTRRLTTPFDLHETLEDLVDPFKLNEQFLMDRYEKQTLQRGYSLFDKIPPTRSCDDAGVTPHWCTCQTTKKLSTDNKIAFEVANFTVYEHINPLLEGFAECAFLELDEIIDARLQTNTNELMKEHSSEDYTVTFKTRPGGAIFEATIRKHTEPNDVYHYSITGTVSRINLYGDQSMCVTDFHLKLYCFCKQFL